VGGWIREIDVAMLREVKLEDSAWSALMLVLLRTPHLEVFEMKDRPVLVAHVECLRISATRLRSMSILLEDDLLAAMPIVGGLKSLYELKIGFSKRKAVWDWTAADSTKIELPRVERFSWLWLAPCPSGVVPRLLSRFAFAPRAHFTLEMHRLSAPDAALLAGWLSAHSLAMLAIRAPPEALGALGQAMSRIPDVRFVTMPSARVFGDRPWPAVISLYPHNTDSLDAVAVFLDGVVDLLKDGEARARIVPFLKRIRLIGLHGTDSVGNFYWNSAMCSAEDSFHELRGRLKPIASRLRKHRIRLLDITGRSSRKISKQ
jgi:hypothetical protein